MLHFGLVTGVSVVPAGWVLTQSQSVFFVLSGFILAYRYTEVRGAGATARYLAARIGRIWPLHLVTLAAVVAVLPLPFQPEVGPGTLLLNAFLLHAWVPVYSVYASFNSASFSLSIELFLYLCFPLLLRGRAWTWVLKIGVPLALAVGMIAVADGAAGDLPDNVDATGLVYNHPISRLWEFAIGVAAARAWGTIAGRLPRRFATATVLEAVTAVLVLGNLVLGGRAAEWLGGAAGLGQAARLWLANAGLTALPIAALLVALAHGRGAISRAMSVRPAVLLGEISYSTYLLHGLVLLPIVFRWDVFRSLSDVHLTAAFVGAVLVLSYLSWALVEVPGRALVLRAAGRLGRRERAEAARVRLDAAAGLRPRALVACAAALVAIGASVVVAAPEAVSLRGLRDLGGAAVSGWDRGGWYVVPPGGSIEVGGWAVDGQGRGIVRGVVARVEGRGAAKTWWLRGGLERADVVRRSGDGRFRYSGFAGRIDAAGLAPGSYRIDAAAVLFDPQGYIELPPARLVVR